MPLFNVKYTPLAPAQPPLGAGAHAMPLYYMYKIFLSIVCTGNPALSQLGDARICRNKQQLIRFTPPDDKNRQIIISTVLIRRGGAPPGAAAFIVFGGMGVSTPISNSGRPIYYGNVLEIFSLCVLVAFQHHVRLNGKPSFQRDNQHITIDWDCTIHYYQKLSKYRS